jgi:hypothetical protein
LLLPVFAQHASFKLMPGGSRGLAAFRALLWNVGTEAA